MTQMVAAFADFWLTVRFYRTKLLNVISEKVISHFETFSLLQQFLRKRQYMLLALSTTQS